MGSVDSTSTSWFPFRRQRIHFGACQTRPFFKHGSTAEQSATQPSPGGAFTSIAGSQLQGSRCIEHDASSPNFTIEEDHHRPLLAFVWDPIKWLHDMYEPRRGVRSVGSNEVTGQIEAGRLSPSSIISLVIKIQLNLSRPALLSSVLRISPSGKSNVTPRIGPRGLRGIG